MTKAMHGTGRGCGRRPGSPDPDRRGVELKGDPPPSGGQSHLISMGDEGSSSYAGNDLTIDCRSVPRE